MADSLRIANDAPKSKIVPKIDKSRSIETALPMGSLGSARVMSEAKPPNH